MICSRHAWRRNGIATSTACPTTAAFAGKGYVEESGYTGGAYLDITPLADLKLTVGAELLFDRQLRLYDKGGDEFSKTDVDRALGAVLRASYSF